LNKLHLRGAGFSACSALLIAVALLLVTAFPLQSHDPITTKLTWTAEISRIVYKRCAGCHRPGGAAFSLMTYEDARPWAKAIRDETMARRMPPWGAVQGIGDFKADPSLSGPEIDMFVAWVEGGAPEGDPIYLPHRVPQISTPKAEAPAHSLNLPVAREAKLSRAARLVALQPKNLAEGQSLDAWAVKPDGEVLRLIWLKDYRKQDPGEYVFREPVLLPAATRLRVSAGPNSSLVFLLQEPSAGSAKPRSSPSGPPA
jgi:hypothetical protein